PTLRLWTTLNVALVASAGAVWLALGGLKAALREAESSERRFARLFHGAPDGIVSLGPEGRIESINPAAESLLGVHARAAVGRRLPELVPPQEAGTSLEDAIAQEGRGPVLVQLTPAGGASLWVEVNSRTHSDEGGEQRTELTLRDVTDRVSAEAERRELEAELAEARQLEAVGRLAGGIAHDCNNLLTVIQANSELLLEHQEPPEVRERVREMHDAAESAATLTRQLLAFASRQVLEPEWIELDEVIRGILPILGRVTGEDVELEVELTPDLGSIRADRTQLQHVMINLVTNARDALPDGGRIHIETARAGPEEPPGRPDPVPGSVGWLRLRVSDTGVGMDEETLASAFEPFFSRKDTGRGTGLGLASVYGIVRQSGGHVHVESRVGQGSVFSVYLPEHTRRPRHAAPTQTVQPEQPGSETILLVEDDTSVRHVIARMLGRAGYRVVAAACASEAMAALEAEPAPIDLLLTDVVMPGLSGPKLAEQLTHERPGLKVVFMSGHTEDTAISDVTRKNGALFLAKPPSRRELLAKLRQALDSRPTSSRGSGPAPSPAAGTTPEA
ncbi:MAG: hybrid sensor histidine kinase/response regulator, partial [Myxococcota bacterium]